MDEQNLAHDEEHLHGEWDDVAPSRRPRMRCECCRMNGTITSYEVLFFSRDKEARIGVFICSMLSRVWVYVYVCVL